METQTGSYKEAVDECIQKEFGGFSESTARNYFDGMFGMTKEEEQKHGQFMKAG